MDTSRNFRLALEIIFLLSKYFFLRMESRKRNKRGVVLRGRWEYGKFFVKKKITGGRGGGRGAY